MIPAGTPKQKLYQTAYAPTYQAYVGLDHAHQDDRGEWIWTGHFTDPTDGKTYVNFLFRKEELTDFVL